MLRTTRIAAVAAVAALFVPVASATNLITDTLAPGGGTSVGGYHFVTDTLAPGGGIPVPAEGYRFPVNPGNPAPAEGPVGYRFITDTLAPGGGNSSGVSVTGGNDFSWADAGIGAVIAGGLMLLALIGRHLADRKRRGQLAY